MKILLARREGADLHYIVHLDESKTVDDPEWTRPTIADKSWTAPLIPDPRWRKPKGPAGLIAKAPLVPDPTASRPFIPDPAAQAPQVPDPSYLLDARWGAIDRKPDEESAAAYAERAADYEAMTLRELKLLAHDALARMSAADHHVLAHEGKSL